MIFRDSSFHRRADGIDAELHAVGGVGGQASLRALQIGRGLAALLVVLFHLNNSVWGTVKYFPHAFSETLSFGNSGVQFFFVLSGFIIYLVHDRDVGLPDRLQRFAWRRFIRVYPVYWLVLFAFVVMLAAAPQLGTADERDLTHIIASVLLTPSPKEPVLVVAWTLTHEVLFYAMFAIAILHARVGTALFVAWQLGCVANMLFGSSDFPYRVIFSANNLLFSFGLIAAFLFKADTFNIWRRSGPGWLTAGGSVAFICTGLHQVHAAAVLIPTDGHIIAYGLAAAAIILGACSFERQHALRMPRFLDALGDASYSIYLIHLPLLSLLAKILFTSGLARLFPETLSLVLLLGAVAVTGIAFSKLVEMPLIAALGRLSVRGAPNAGAPQPS